MSPAALPKRMRKGAASRFPDAVLLQMLEMKDRGLVFYMLIFILNFPESRIEVGIVMFPGMAGIAEMDITRIKRNGNSSSCIKSSLTFYFIFFDMKGSRF